jgi:hypothetical protein
MEIVSILRALRRHWLLVAAGAGLAGLVAIVLTFHATVLPPKLGSRQQTSAYATARVFIAARTQPAFDLESQLTDTLGTRAALLADLLSTDAGRAKIARAAGLDPGQVGVVTPAMKPPVLALALPVSASEAASTASEPYVLTVNADGTIPIISLGARGPDAIRAGRVVNAAAASIGDLIATRSSGRPDIVVERLGPAVTRTVVNGPRKAIAAAAAVVIFSLWCFALVVVSGLSGRGRRRRAAATAPQYSPST